MHVRNNRSVTLSGTRTQLLVIQFGGGCELFSVQLSFTFEQIIFWSLVLRINIVVL